MASIHYEGLDGWKKSAAFWGALGIIVGITQSIPMGWAAGGLLAGGAVGAARAFWLGKMNTRAANITDWAAPLALAAGMYFVFVSGEGPEMPTIGFFGLGCLFLSAKQLAFGLLGTRAMKRVNDSNAHWLGKLDPPVKRMGPPPPERDASACREDFLNALPEPLRRDFRRAVVEVTDAVPYRSPESLPATCSALGGTPLLAPGQTWPCRNGKPLEFLAQINLAEVPDGEVTMPTSGLLSFFYDTRDQPWGADPDDLGAAVVLLSPDPLSAIPARRTGDPGQPLLRQPLAFRRVAALVLPEAPEDAFHELLRSLPNEEAARLSSLRRAVLETSPSGHRLASPPDRIQGDMEPELATAAKAYGLPEDTRWTMLLQLDSSEDLEWQWADSGLLYFWLPTDDLAVGRFDRAWVVLQSH